MKTSISRNRPRGLALVFVLLALALLSSLVLTVLVNTRVESQSVAASRDLAAIRDGELTWAAAHGGSFTTNLADLALPAQTNGFTYLVAGSNAFAFAADLARWGITNAAFQIALASNAPVVANLIPGAVDARRAALDRAISNGLVTIQAVLATNSPSVRAQAVAAASSLHQLSALFGALDTNADGALTWNELLAADPDTNAPLGAYLAYLRDEFSLGVAGENLAALPGLRFSDLAPPPAGLAAAGLLAATNAPSTNLWPVRGILYSRTGSPSTIWVCTADGAPDRFLTYGHWPRVSPDGRWLVFHTTGGLTPQQSNLKLRDLQTGAESTLFLNAPNSVFGCDFTADSAQLLFDWNCGLYALNLADGSSNLLFNVDCSDRMPVRNPATGTFAFQTQKPGGNGLGLFNYDPAHPLASPNRRNLPNSQLYYDRAPVWSPDGQWLAFHHALGEDPDNFFIIRADGSQRTQLTFFDDQDPDTLTRPAAWTPDGRWLVFARLVGGSTNGLWAVATDGSGTLRAIPSAPPIANYDYVGAVTANLPLPSAVAVTTNFSASAYVALGGVAPSNASVNVRVLGSAYTKLLPTDPIKPLAALYLAADPGAGVTLRSAGVPPAAASQVVGNLELGSLSANESAAAGTAALRVRWRGPGRIAGNVFNLAGLVSTVADPVLPVTAPAWPVDPSVPGQPPATNVALFPGAGNFTSTAALAAAPGFVPPSPAVPTDPIRVLTVAGNYFQSGGGALGLVLGGPDSSAATYDQLRVEGTATLAGTLAVALADHNATGTPTTPYTPQAGDTFDVVSAPRVVVENLRLDAPQFGAGLGLRAYVVDTTNGDQALRLQVTNVPVPLLIARNASNSAPQLDWPLAYPNYTLQANTNLATTNWTTVATGTNATTLTVTNAAGNGKGFYRLVAP